MPKPVYIRYIVASGGALGVDMAVFMAALILGFAPVAAAAAGYLSGIVAHWLLSSRVVFAGHVGEAGPERIRQQALFLGSALVGLGITTGVVALGGVLGGDPRLAKLAAIAVSFQVTYVLRRKVVFAC